MGNTLVTLVLTLCTFSLKPFKNVTCSLQTDVSVTDGSGTIGSSALQCTGDESKLAECPQADWGDNDCDHSTDVGLECQAREFTIIILFPREWR